MRLHARDNDDVNLSGAASLLMCRAHKLAVAGIKEAGRVSEDNGMIPPHGYWRGTAAGTRDVKLRRDLQYRKRLSGHLIGKDVGGLETLLPHRTTNRLGSFTEKSIIIEDRPKSLPNLLVRQTNKVKVENSKWGNCRLRFDPPPVNCGKSLLAL